MARKVVTVMRSRLRRKRNMEGFVPGLARHAKETEVGSSLLGGLNTAAGIESNRGKTGASRNARNQAAIIFTFPWRPRTPTAR